MVGISDRCLVCDDKFADGDIVSMVSVENEPGKYPKRKSTGGIHSNFNRDVISCKNIYELKEGEEIHNLRVVFGHRDYDALGNLLLYAQEPVIETIEHGERVMNVRNFILSHI